MKLKEFKYYLEKAQKGAYDAFLKEIKAGNTAQHVPKNISSIRRELKVRGLRWSYLPMIESIDFNKTIKGCDYWNNVMSKLRKVIPNNNCFHYSNEFNRRMKVKRRRKVAKLDRRAALAREELHAPPLRAGIPNEEIFPF